MSHQVFGNLTQPAKQRPNLFGVVDQRHHAHQADQPHARKRTNLFAEDFDRTDRDALFAFLAGDVDLQQNVRHLIALAGFAADFLRQAQRIDRMKYGRPLHSRSHFVSLQVADHMPDGNNRVALTVEHAPALLSLGDHRGPLSQLLYAALAQIHQPRVKDDADHLHVHALGDRHQAHRCRIAIRPTARQSDALAYALDVVLDLALNCLGRRLAHNSHGTPPD